MNRSITNPILKGFNPDPSFLRVDDDYYIATSTFQWFPGVSIYHSTNLIDWKLISRPLNSIKLLDLKGVPDSGGVWAPDLSYANGKFWLVYSNVKSLDAAFKDTPNFLITTDDVSGEWSDPVFLNANGFDASMFHDDNGRHYLLNMVWDHRMYQHQFYGIQMREYSYKNQSLIGEAKIIWTGTKDGLTEGPHLYKIKDYYYLFCAQGGTHWAHQEIAARSHNIWGSYISDPSGCFLTSIHDPYNYMQKAGHASMIQTKNGEYYIAHLMARPLHHDNESIIDPRGWSPLGRETSIQKIQWTSDGWPQVIGGKQGSSSVDVPYIELPTKSIYPLENNTIEKFETAELPSNFQTLRVPFEEIGTITDNQKLRIYGHESPSSRFTYSQVSRRWQSFNFIAETMVTFDPDNFQQFAGMSNYYDSQNYSIIYITYDEQKSAKVIEVIVCDANDYSFVLQNNAIVIPDYIKNVYFRTVEKGNSYTYSYSFDGQDFINIVTLDSLKLSDDYIKEKYGPSAYFTGAFVGMFAVDLTGQNKYAEFDYFNYIDK